MKIPFLKVHGSKNDFLLIDERTQSFTLTEGERAQLALTYCNREKGIGADGILFVSESDHAEAKMIVMNADGTEASMCGNGLRCVARYVSETNGKDMFLVETKQKTLHVGKEAPMATGVPAMKVEISPVSFRAATSGWLGDEESVQNQVLSFGPSSRLYTIVSIPNPHLVTFVDEEVLETTEQETVAKQLNEKNSFFEDGVNVSYVVPTDDGLFVRTYERGVGFTNACGTAMSASTYVACLQRRFNFGEKVDVWNPGGKVQCVAYNTDDEAYVYLIGNATYEQKGHIDVTTGHTDVEEIFHDEATAYARFEQEVKDSQKRKSGCF
ncbi:diaminopimelate epimerase [Bacillus fonticola]|uniref:diaminopimelate epimerase n=1 Tax=Bacillus fonticola TaxID=2728853 RepID=UPI0014741B46|nr:diaminopimelate epimerase [Bacillus fonticola]